MTIPELHSKYMNETCKHPINENSKEGAYSDEYVAWLQNLVVNNEVLDLVMQSKWLLYEETKFVADGIYKVKTDKNRFITAERFMGSWMEYEENIIEGEKVIGYFA